ncbi:coproporphyrinogen-III oxidase family protein [Paenibacillus sp. NPDC057934]|uniref:coproporphyrinogen-III oxidase family protein n=1 Tax=Paenibacillus sp. NPDC057934 TaxID=3346282 RepID=UPI0036DC1DCC
MSSENSNVISDSSFWREYPERDVEFVRWYPCNVGKLSGQEMFATGQDDSKEFSFYIHVPFCNNVCICCPYNKFTTRSKILQEYLEALKLEITNYAKQDYVKNAKFVSGYFGGGTPTTLSAEQLEDLFQTLYRELNIAEDASITIETTPVDITEEKAKVFMKYGINRVSIGVQALDDVLLKRIGRNYSGDQAIATISMLKKIGIKHVCADLMWGLPGQTEEEWRDTLTGMIDLKLVDSFSLYQYTVLPSSPLYLRMERGIIPKCPDEKIQQEMYWESVEILHNAGFLSVSDIDFVSPHVLEIESEANYFTIPDTNGKVLISKTCAMTRHVAHTWYEGKPMLAIGSGAYGYLNHSMYLNEPDIREYIRKVKEETYSVVMGKYVTDQERMVRTMVLGIKLLRFYREDFRRMHGKDMMEVFADQINQMVEWGLLELTEEYVEVTFPKGWYYMENISKMFYSEENYGLPQPNATGTILLQLLK